MSADNWGTCPRCKAEGELREDHDLGILGKAEEFYVNYKAQCYKCDFKFTYGHFEDLGKKEG